MAVERSLMTSPVGCTVLSSREVGSQMTLPVLSCKEGDGSIPVWGIRPRAGKFNLSHRDLVAQRWEDSQRREDRQFVHSRRGATNPQGRVWVNRKKYQGSVQVRGRDR